MNTGIDSYGDLGSISTLFPFAGSEIVLVILTLLGWIGFHVWQIRNENNEYREALAELDPGSAAAPEEPVEEPELVATGERSGE
jgi:predicted negative regulator of RcsB-dependent stress response